VIRLQQGAEGDAGSEQVAVDQEQFEHGVHLNCYLGEHSLRPSLKANDTAYHLYQQVT
jgi:hypothetical protein